MKLEKDAQNNHMIKQQSVTILDKEENKNEQSIAVVRGFNVREDLFNTWAKSSENEHNQSLDERTKDQIPRKSTKREDLQSEIGGNTLIVESDPSFAKETESERYTTLNT